MKKLFLFLTLVLFLANCYSQESCSCMDRLNWNKTAIITKPSIIEKNGSKYLKFYCSGVRRIYYNNKKGLEQEKFQLECISNIDTLIKITPTFKYYYPEAKNKTIKELQKVFFQKIKLRGKKFYEITIDDNKVIDTVSDFIIP